MKTKILYIATITSLLLLSFNTIDNSESKKVIQKSIPYTKLETKNVVLANYYSDIIKNEVDKRFSESKGGNINEKEMITTVLSYGTIKRKMEKVIAKNVLDENLEAKKTVLVNFYSNLIKNEIDRLFIVSKDGNINEEELINAVFIKLPEYGCAFAGSNCSGSVVCGVSMLYASTFGYGSFSGEGGGGCEGVE